MLPYIAYMDPSWVLVVTSPPSFPYVLHIKPHTSPAFQVHANHANHDSLNDLAREPNFFCDMDTLW